MGHGRPGVSRAISPAGFLLVGALAILGGCTSANKMGDYVPASTGGLPEGAPERPATPYAYPAVHDMPPPRESAVLTSDEQKKLEDDLAAARKRAAAAGGSGGSAASTGKQ
jgi:hypothetical protein